MIISGSFYSRYAVVASETIEGAVSAFYTTLAEYGDKAKELYPEHNLTLVVVSDNLIDKPILFSGSAGDACSINMSMIRK